MTENQFGNPILMERLNKIRAQVTALEKEYGRKPGEVAIMAVTKTIPPQIVNQALGWGITLLGENRVQELQEKYPFYQKENCQIHFIGHLQTNKVKYIIDKVSMIHSVDSIKLAAEIDKRCREIGKVMDILVEVNIGKEASKAGIFPEELEELLCQLSSFPNIKVKGLMAIPPKPTESMENGHYFSQMQELFIDISSKKLDNISMSFLSMGMSGDYASAIQYGSNIIRLGSAIFGQRV